MQFRTSTSSVTSILLLFTIFSTFLTSSYAAPIPLRRRALHSMIPSANLPYWNAILAGFAALPNTDMWLTGDTAKWVHGLLDGTPGEQQVIDNASPIHIAFTTVPSDIGSVKGLTLVQMSPGSVGYTHEGQNIPLVIYQGPSPASRKKEYAGDQEIDIDDGSLNGLTVVPVNL